MLLQSGETCGGQPLVDRQHPHDFFMELGAVYERALSSNVAFLLYAAPAGEPALGPVAFMHRPSAMDEPQAPLGHHWQDATHISFGVLTAGLYTRTLRVEASAFNGHEPDERRWNFDPIRLNSYSARVTFNPTPNWSFSTGFGRLDNPERTTPPEDVRRLVASAMHGRRLGPDAQWATTLVYGRNAAEHHPASHSVLLESEAVLDRRNTVFGRAEYVQKSGHDLQVPGVDDEQIFDVGALSPEAVSTWFHATSSPRTAPDSRWAGWCSCDSDRSTSKPILECQRLASRRGSTCMIEMAQERPVAGRGRPNDYPNK
jgi:hypothetical protein